MTNWYMCNSVADGCTGPSNIRECPCGAQVLVSVVMTPLVDSGELRARCWPCLRKSGGGTVTLHPVEADAFAELGLLDDAWRTIGEINEGIDDRGMP